MSDRLKRSGREPDIEKERGQKEANPRAEGENDRQRGKERVSSGDGCSEGSPARAAAESDETRRQRDSNFEKIREAVMSCDDKLLRYLWRRYGDGGARSEYHNTRPSNTVLVFGLFENCGVSASDIRMAVIKNAESEPETVSIPRLPSNQPRGYALLAFRTTGLAQNLLRSSNGHLTVSFPAFPEEPSKPDVKLVMEFGKYDDWGSHEGGIPTTELLVRGLNGRMTGEQLLAGVRQVAPGTQIVSAFVGDDPEAVGGLREFGFLQLPDAREARKLCEDWPEMSLPGTGVRVQILFPPKVDGLRGTFLERVRQFTAAELPRWRKRKEIEKNEEDPFGAVFALVEKTEAKVVAKKQQEQTEDEKDEIRRTLRSYYDNWNTISDDQREYYKKYYSYYFSSNAQTVSAGTETEEVQVQQEQQQQQQQQQPHQEECVSTRPERNQQEEVTPGDVAVPGRKKNVLPSAALASAIQAKLDAAKKSVVSSDKGAKRAGGEDEDGQSKVRKTHKNEGVRRLPDLSSSLAPSRFNTLNSGFTEDPVLPSSTPTGFTEAGLDQAPLATLTGFTEALDPNVTEHSGVTPSGFSE